MTTPIRPLSNTQLLTGLVDGQSYVVTETSANAAGFSLTGLVCTGGGRGHHGDIPRRGVATIGFDAGETIVCTYTNTQQGSVSVVKDTVPNGPADFAFTATNGATPAGFSLDDDADPALSNTQAVDGPGGRPDLCGDRDVGQRGGVLVDEPGVHRRRDRHHGDIPRLGWRRSGSTPARRSCARTRTPSRVRCRW